VGINGLEKPSAGYFQQMAGTLENGAAC
jgi:hypothetical protein